MQNEIILYYVEKMYDRYHLLPVILQLITPCNMSSTSSSSPVISDSESPEEQVFGLGGLKTVMKAKDSYVGLSTMSFYRT